MSVKMNSTNMPSIQYMNKTDRSHGQFREKNEKIVLQSQKDDNIVTDRNKKEVKTTVEKLNDFIDPVRTNLKFVFHEELHEYYVTVINPHTDEVIREIPPKKMLDMYAAMAEYMGLLIDEKI